MLDVGYNGVCRGFAHGVDIDVHARNRHAAGNPGGSWTIVDCEDDLGVNLNIKPGA
jgi:hypothetical protein